MTRGTGILTRLLRCIGVTNGRWRRFDYCKRYPGDQPIDPGNYVWVSPIEPGQRALY